MVVLDFYIQGQSPGTTGRKWKEPVATTHQKKQKKSTKIATRDTGGTLSRSKNDIRASLGLDFLHHGPTAAPLSTRSSKPATQLHRLHF